jgi:hypothetical protein
MPTITGAYAIYSHRQEQITLGIDKPPAVTNLLGTEEAGSFYLLLLVTPEFRVIVCLCTDYFVLFRLPFLLQLLQ